MGETQAGTCISRGCRADLGQKADRVNTVISKNPPFVLYHRYTLPLFIIPVCKLFLLFPIPVTLVGRCLPFLVWREKWEFPREEICPSLPLPSLSFHLQPQTVNEVFARQLMQISGISGEKAAAILERYKTPARYRWRGALLSLFQAGANGLEAQGCCTRRRRGQLKSSTRMEHLPSKATLL